MGKENDEIKFKQFPEEKLLSLKYVGGYSHLRDAYKELLKISKTITSLLNLLLEKYMLMAAGIKIMKMTILLLLKL